MKYKDQIQTSIEKLLQLNKSIILGIEMKTIDSNGILEKVQFATRLLDDIEDKLTLEHNVFEK